MKSPGGPVDEVESVVIRFAGDSGDGVQLTGGRFTAATALAGNDLATFPDFPAEIRAPAGTLPGVSGFQINFSSSEALTPGDMPQVLVAFNPAALKANIKDLERGGTVLVNTDAFTAQNLKKAGYAADPLEDGSLASYRVVKLPMNTLTKNALEGMPLNAGQVGRCKNFFALGVMCWLYERKLEPTLDWIKSKFGKVQAMVDANSKALHAGHAFAETAELFERRFRVAKAPIAPGLYRNITGNEALALGLVAASKLSEQPLFYASYPITPASDLLHRMATLKEFGVKTFQTEDEIAAMGAVVGAAFGGSLAVTGTSGPGVALKSEMIGLAVMAELPVVIVNVQRAGPSTGMPTKTEQADLLQACFGRGGEAPAAILAPATPGECFHTAVEACRLAMKYRHPVFILSDGYLGNGSEPWRVPDVDALPKITISHDLGGDPKDFKPYRRDKELIRPWVVPGTPGCEHRIGGLEKDHETGNVSYDPDNHERMIRLRAEKVAGMAREIPPTEIMGPDKGRVLVVGWGSTYGAITKAVRELQAEGAAVSAVHLRHLNPLPADLGDILKRFDEVLVPEMNLGQLSMLLRAEYLVPAKALSKVKGQPFKASEICEGIEGLLKGGEGDHGR